MMISPEVYIDSLKDYTLQQLYKERDELIQAIKYYEEGKFEEKEVFTIPSPETVYKYNKDEYLPRLEILIAKKEQNNFVSFKMDNYTNFYLKISRKKDFQYDPYDRWCDVSISISNNATFIIAYFFIVFKIKSHHDLPLNIHIHNNLVCINHIF